MKRARSGEPVHKCLRRTDYGGERAQIGRLQPSQIVGGPARRNRLAATFAFDNTARSPGFWTTS